MAVSPQRVSSCSSPVEPDPCPLNDPEFPTVSELDHFVSQCYCHLCTCAQHKCPSENKRMFPAALFKGSSQYKLAYKRHLLSPMHSCKKVELYSPKSYGSNNFTTTQLDFQGYSVKPSETVSATVSPKRPPAKFIGRSSYETNFPNWGANPVERIKGPPNHYRGNEVKFAGKTVYSTEFEGKPLPKWCQDNVTERMLQRTGNSWGFATHSEQFLKISNFIQPVQKPKREKGPISKYTSQRSWATQYNSTYKSEFLASPPKQHFRKKRELKVF